MKTSALFKPGTIEVNRSQLRQNQSTVLKKATGRTVVVVRSNRKGSEKCVMDRQYFEEILAKLKAAQETLQITADAKLFPRLLRAARTIDRDARQGKLHSFEEAFGKG